METVHMVRAHPSFDSRALLVVEDGRVAGDPGQPCAGHSPAMAEGARHRGTFLTIAAYRAAAQSAP